MALSEHGFHRLEFSIAEKVERCGACDLLERSRVAAARTPAGFIARDSGDNTNPCSEPGVRELLKV